jgi:hypothetical protein
MDDPATWHVQIAAVEGRCDCLPGRRAYEIRLEGSRRPDRVLLDSLEASDWSYDAEALRTTIRVSPRDKRQALTVCAIARDGMSALGEAHNRQCILSDVRRLVGEDVAAGEGEEGLLDALLRTDCPGRADAIARLGGPVVRFVEFTTPEEVAQQLGRAIIGAPSRPGESLDLQVIWTLWQSGEKRQQTVTIEGSTESHIVDAPFAFDGQVQTMHWTAEARVTWRGQVLVFRHHSQPLFPSIYAWQSVVYDQGETPLTVEQVMGPGGHVNRQLAWKPTIQAFARVRNVNQPLRVVLFREHADSVKAGAPLAAYLATTITSPDDRDAVVQFRSAGPTTFYLNGQVVDEEPVEQDRSLPPLLRKARCTAVLRLRSGRNWLLVHSQPPQEKRPSWYLEGRLTTPEGETMTDLVFEADVAL